MDDSLQVERARRGDRDAFDAIYAAHAAGTWRLALAVQAQADAAGTAVAGAFGTVLSPRWRTRDRQRPVRLQLLAAARDAAVTGDVRPGGADLAAPETTLIELFASGSTVVRDHSAVDAFERLPEHWRSVLWLTEVEGLDLEQTATVIGLPVPTTTELAGRALAGLREQFALARVASVSAPDCQRTASLLGGYGSSSLSPRDTTRVRHHLDECDACRDRLDEIDDLPPHLRWAIPVLPAAVFGLALEAWATHIDNATGPLGLTLPGGRPVPPWAERALAGATAAVVTLGITGAILAGGRGGKDRSPELAGTGTEQPISEGESALGASLDDGRSTTGIPTDGVVGGTPDVVADLPRSTDGATSTPTTDGALPRGGPASTPPTTVAPVTPVTPVTPVAPDEPDPVEPAPEEPSGSTPPVAAIRVDEDTAVSVGGSCTGVEVLGIVVGCEPASETETTLPLVPSLLP